MIGDQNLVMDNNIDDYSRIFETDEIFYTFIGSSSSTLLGLVNRYYYVILNKDYRGYRPLSSKRVVYFSRSQHLELQKRYKPYRKAGSIIFDNFGFPKSGPGGAESFKNAKKFPQDSNGYYIPQEYWDEFGYI